MSHNVACSDAEEEKNYSTESFEIREEICMFTNVSFAEMAGEFLV